MLGIIGIPAGILLGTGVIYLLVVILNALLGSMLNGISFAFALPWWVAVVSAVMSAVIILFSTLSSAFRASRIAPITAIRGNNDIKINKKRKAINHRNLLKSCLVWAEKLPTKKP